MARAQLDSKAGLGGERARRQQRYVALAVCGGLVICAVASALFGRGQGPVIKPFIPIAGTVWLLADLLTAFLLLAQFYVNGRLSFAILSIGYGFSGLLTIPYLLAFPGLFVTGPVPIGDPQLSLVFWVAWHCCFPVIVMLSRVGTNTEDRLTSREKIRTLTVVLFFVPVVAASAVTALVFADRAALPHLIVDGHFQAVYRVVCLPAIIALNFAACAVLLARRERLNALGLMLCIAMFAAFIDAALNLSGTRYSNAWDVGKIITIYTASVVLLMFLSEIVDWYGRLEGAARTDALTQLPNRRALDEHLQLVFTISVGIGFFAIAAELDAPVIFEAADHALYEAKWQARNRIVLSIVRRRVAWA